MSLADKISISGITDTGLVRSNNEDTIGSDAELGLLVLADGMGGHKEAKLPVRLRSILFCRN